MRDASGCTRSQRTSQVVQNAAAPVQTPYVQQVSNRASCTRYVRDAAASLQDTRGKEATQHARRQWVYTRPTHTPSSAERSSFSADSIRAASKQQPFIHTLPVTSTSRVSSWYIKAREPTISQRSVHTVSKHTKPNTYDTSATHSFDRGHWHAQARQTTKPSQAQNVVTRTVLANGQRCVGGTQHDTTH